MIYKQLLDISLVASVQPVLRAERSLLRVLPLQPKAPMSTKIRINNVIHQYVKFSKEATMVNLLTEGGRYGGRRGKAPKGLLKALSKAL